MSTIDIRPRFKEHCELPAEEVLERLRQLLDRPESGIVGRVSFHHAVLKVTHEDRHYWSPQLNISVDEEPDGSLIYGLFGPRGSVWLMFIFFYSVLGVIALFIGITGGAQAALGQPAPVLWVIPICAVLAIALFFIAKTGERLGREQMQLLYQAFRLAL
ncbi:MAG: hypothetical protein KDC54_15415, partial [Lewinella sp.]|nr:hypothetical protein [Lewinella sp.]